jgi:hypothetical protein
MSKSKGWIKGSYIPHRRNMLESLAWRSLNGVAKQILDCLEIEYMRHAGKDNGRLICTYDDMVDYGIRRASIGPGIRLVSAAGFLVVERRGSWSADHANPTLYRLTYLPTDGANPTDEWRNYLPNSTRGSLSEYAARPKRPQNGPKIQNLGSDIATSTRSENAPCTRSENATSEEPKSEVAKTLLPSINLPIYEESEGLDIPTFLRRGRAGCPFK